MNHDGQLLGHHGSLELRAIPVTIGLVLVYLAVSLTMSQFFLRTGTPMTDPAIGLVVPLSITFGVAGVLASAIGVLAVAATHGTIGVDPFVVAAAHGGAGYLAWWVTRRMSGTADVGRIRHIAGWLGRYVLVGLTGAAVAGAAIGLGRELFGIAPFYLAAVVAIQYAVATLTLGLFVLFVIRVFWPVQTRSLVGGRSDPRFVAATAAVGVAWLTLGVIGSLGFANLVRIPAWALHDVGAGVLVPLANPAIFGRGAVRAQIVLAAVAIGVLVLLLVGTRHDAEVDTCD